jgi:hypothetical protein
MKRILLVLAVPLCAVILVLGAFFIALYFAFDMPGRESTMVFLPDGAYAIEHSRVRINPLVAEYKRDATYVSGGVRGKTTPLQIDTCGGYPINCYWIETPHGPFLRLDDAVSEHLLDLSNQTTYAVGRFGSIAYVGELASEHESFEYGQSSVNNGPWTSSVTFDQVPAKPMTDLTQQDTRGVYIGRLSGGDGHLRFVSAADSPEVAIRHH